MTTMKLRQIRIQHVSAGVPNNGGQAERMGSRRTFVTTSWTDICPISMPRWNDSDPQSHRNPLSSLSLNTGLALPRLTSFRSRVQTHRLDGTCQSPVIINPIHNSLP